MPCRIVPCPVVLPAPGASTVAKLPAREGDDALTAGAARKSRAAAAKRPKNERQPAFLTQSAVIADLLSLSLSGPSRLARTCVFDSFGSKRLREHCGGCTDRQLSPPTDAGAWSSPKPRGARRSNDGSWLAG